MYLNQHLVRAVAAQHQTEARRQAAAVRAVRHVRLRSARPHRPPPAARHRRRVHLA